jgi:hypothetical protein
MVRTRKKKLFCQKERVMEYLESDLVAFEPDCRGRYGRSFSSICIEQDDGLRDNTDISFPGWDSLWIDLGGEG